MLACSVRRAASAALNSHAGTLNSVPVRYAGHNKWSKIHRAKSVADKKQGIRINAVLRALRQTVATGGPDMKRNYALARLYQSAFKLKIEKSILDSAVKKAVASPMQDIVLEGRSPLGFNVVLMVSSGGKLSRAAVQNAFSKTMQKQPLDIAPGSALFTFDKKGLVTVARTDDLADPDDLAIECEAEDWMAGEDVEGNPTVQFICAETEVHSVKDALTGMNIEVSSTEIGYLPKGERVEVKDEDVEATLGLFDALDEHPDVSSYYTNVAGR